jgi:hypothetical protein
MYHVSLGFALIVGFALVLTKPRCATPSFLMTRVVLLFATLHILGPMAALWPGLSQTLLSYQVPLIQPVASFGYQVVLAVAQVVPLAYCNILRLLRGLQQHCKTCQQLPTPDTRFLHHPLPLYVWLRHVCKSFGQGLKMPGPGT